MPSVRLSAPSLLTLPMLWALAACGTSAAQHDSTEEPHDVAAEALLGPDASPWGTAGRHKIDAATAPTLPRAAAFIATQVRSTTSTCGAFASVGTASPTICVGEDWSLPSGVGRSDAGVVWSGYGDPYTSATSTTNDMHNVTRGSARPGKLGEWIYTQSPSSSSYASQATRTAAWKAYLSSTSPNTLDVRDDWMKLAMRGLWEANERYCFEVHDTTSAASSSASVWSGAGQSYTDPSTGASKTEVWGGASGKLYSTNAACSGQLRWSALETGEFGGLFPSFLGTTGAALPTMKDLWNANPLAAACTTGGCSEILSEWTTWESAGYTEFVPWDAGFMQMRKRFFAAFADNVLKYYDNRGVTRYVPVNAEGGFVPFLYRLGFLTQAELDSWQAQMVTDVAAAGVTSTRMMVNLAYGGREQYGFAKAGWEAGAELATHGPDSILTLPFAQYLRARYYDPTYKAYRPVAGAEDTFRFHTDLARTIHDRCDEASLGGGGGGPG